MYLISNCLVNLYTTKNNQKFQLYYVQVMFLVLDYSKCCFLFYFYSLNSNITKQYLILNLLMKRLTEVMNKQVIMIPLLKR